ncbi:unnamed protein product [Protopolystoma xenopodis]|uniref:Secreted protein n=1 Tax=Protopolystoma xenopodis TaxID=117903 RepID=A0A3S5FBN8_9PLAT|nr:unnamed protein product [Protopolystoma xenopodis]
MVAVSSRFIEVVWFWFRYLVLLAGRPRGTHLVRRPLHASSFPDSDRGLGAFTDGSTASSVSLAILGKGRQSLVCQPKCLGMHQVNGPTLEMIVNFVKLTSISSKSVG